MTRALVLVVCLCGRAFADGPPGETPALAPIARGETPPQMEPPPPDARMWAWAGTAVTGALIVGTGAAYLQVYRNADQLIDANSMRDANAPHAAEPDEHGKWLKLTLGLGGAALVSGAITGYLWSRTEPSFTRMSIVPTNGGGAVSYSGTF